jgi:hypothetical protein
MPIEEEIIGMLDERDDAADNDHIEEVDNVQIGDIMMDRVGLQNARSALVTLKQFLKSRSTDVNTFPLEHLNTSKGDRILVWTIISSNYYRCILSLRLDV